MRPAPVYPAACVPAAALAFRFWEWGASRHPPARPLHDAPSLDTCPQPWPVPGLAFPVKREGAPQPPLPVRPSNGPTPIPRRDWEGCSSGLGKAAPTSSPPTPALQGATLLSSTCPLPCPPRLPPRPPLSPQKLSLPRADSAFRKASDRGFREAPASSSCALRLCGRRDSPRGEVGARTAPAQPRLSPEGRPRGAGRPPPAARSPLTGARSPRGVPGSQGPSGPPRQAGHPILSGAAPSPHWHDPGGRGEEGGREPGARPRRLGGAEARGPRAAGFAEPFLCRAGRGAHCIGERSAGAGWGRPG